jgi:hypothetical protein
VLLAAHRHRIVVIHSPLSPSHRCCPIVVVILDFVNIDVVVVVVVVVVVTAVVFRFPIVVVAIAAIIVVGVVVFAVTVTIDIVACRCRACRAPWLLIQGIRPKKAKAVQLGLHKRRLSYYFSFYVGSMRRIPKNFRSAALSTATQPW